MKLTRLDSVPTVFECPLHSPGAVLGASSNMNTPYIEATVALERSNLLFAHEVERTIRALDCLEYDKLYDWVKKNERYFTGKNYRENMAVHFSDL